jgi:hypothetical protein
VTCCNAMPYRIAVISLLLLLGGRTSKANEVHTQALAACAAFAQDGSQVAATIDAANLSLEVTDPAGKASRLSLALRYPAGARDLENPSMRWHLYSCRAYLSRAGELAAVGISTGLVGSQLQIAVVDLRTLKWIGDWGIGSDAGFSTPVLAGFLESTVSLVVAGEPHAEGGRGTHWGLLTTAVFDSHGKQIAPTHTQRYADDGLIYPRYADPGHNRLWVFRCVVVSASWPRQPLCPVDSIKLTGDQSSPSEYVPSLQGRKRTDLWFLPGTFAAPDANTILFAEGSTLWWLNMEAQNFDRVDLPKHSLADRLGAASLSPDAQALAIGIPRYRLAFPFLMDNYVYEGMDIAVVQLNPFRLLTVLPHGHTVYTPAFAVDHRQGKIIVLVYRQDHWERQELGDSPR